MNPLKKCSTDLGDITRFVCGTYHIGCECEARTKMQKESARMNKFIQKKMFNRPRLHHKVCLWKLSRRLRSEKKNAKRKCSNK